MGQILTHGVYLPNEGERNCYSGLAANWRLLDGAIGTVAAHTTAIAGKADISHTHGNITNDGKVGTTANLPLITGTGGAVQAGSFGNAANTFCEGNDSRLSDARTPVAHTHGKSDVTDLLNSNFIPSANNSYDLGSSSYQWNNLYAKNYYYNGVAWGLDKANTWSGDNTYASIYLKYNSSGQHADLYWRDENNDALCNFRHNAQSITLGKRYTGKTVWYQGAQIAINQNGTIELKSYDGTNSHSIILSSESLYPATTNDLNLGTSTNKWKTLNGINPGALSLPDISEYTNLTSNIPSASLDGSTNIDLSSYITNNGWLSIVVPDTNTDDFVFVQVMGTLANRYFMSGARGAGFISLMMPINRGGDVLAKIKASSVTFCRFYQCMGNV